MLDMVATSLHILKNRWGFWALLRKSAKEQNKQEGTSSTHKFPLGLGEVACMVLPQALFLPLDDLLQVQLSHPSVNLLPSRGIVELRPQD